MHSKLLVGVDSVVKMSSGIRHRLTLRTFHVIGARGVGFVHLMAFGLLMIRYLKLFLGLSLRCLLFMRLLSYEGALPQTKYWVSERVSNVRNDGSEGCERWSKYFGLLMVLLTFGLARFGRDPW